jgi:hypothetical protein
MEITEEMREKVREAVAEAVGDAYDCTRVWSAWSYGTMGEDDFVPVADQADRIAEIADAAIAALTSNASLEGCGAAGGASLSKRLLGTDDERNCDVE